MNVGERVIHLRKQQCLSQDELAKKAGVSRAIIGNSERNTNVPSIEVLLKLAKVFYVSLDFLIREGDLTCYDIRVLKRLEDIKRLDSDTKNICYS